MMCITERHVLLKGMCYKRASLAGRDVLQEYMFYMKAYLTG